MTNLAHDIVCFSLILFFSFLFQSKIKMSQNQNNMSTKEPVLKILFKKLDEGRLTTEDRGLLNRILDDYRLEGFHNAITQTLATTVNADMKILARINDSHAATIRALVALYHGSNVADLEAVGALDDTVETSEESDSGSDLDEGLDADNLDDTHKTSDDSGTGTNAVETSDELGLEPNAVETSDGLDEEAARQSQQRMMELAAGLNNESGSGPNSN